MTSKSFVDLIARLTFDTKTDDAVETLNHLITIARDILESKES